MSEDFLYFKVYNGTTIHFISTNVIKLGQCFPIEIIKSQKEMKDKIRNSLKRSLKENSRIWSELAKY